MVKHTVSWFIKSIAFTSLTFLGAFIILSSNTVLNSHYTYAETNAFCAVPQSVMGVSTSLPTPLNSMGLALFIGSVPLGLWYLAHSRNPKTLW